MKSFSLASIGAVAIIAATPFVTLTLVLTPVWQPSSAIAQNAKKGPVQLRLEAEKKVVQQDKQGKQIVTWQALQGKVTVQPGDVLRYIVTGGNNGDKAVKNLTINQPIPQGMVYVLKSATVNEKQGAKITYSIDGGRSFVENPTIKVTLSNGKQETRPAPATAYTHIRWNFGTSVPAQEKVKGTYQAQVR
ncbi:DUF11 domain-containing protein [Chlorogloeopsis fritschii PCC 9212]|uniref:DUF11 domain-containing protein n=1 Tax=Chlorogloeopsis fritschii PCC 6912 TaxID=211165 RepID=A0A433NA88_CHLFR|nr:DUF11 domain-containing protein [Chlorogloeopsis fritschii]RUR78751.1 hypothetical protein PCC6912_35160 [Chlorogloeopsis fritschii PCC 6912]